MPDPARSPAQLSYTWQLRPPASLAQLQHLMQQWQVAAPLAQVLHGRNLDTLVLETPLQLTPNPALMEAADRLVQAIAQKKRIRIHGDYDADGVTATATLVRGLRALGAQVHGFIPHRLKEGYGIHPSKVPEHAEAADLLVTVDCGVSNLQEVQAMLQLGLEVIVTDHHSPGPEFPSCLVVHPHLTQNYDEQVHNLTGAGVAYHLLWAVHQALGLPEPRALAALATIGTVADVAPLMGENRALVRAGLQELARSELAGVQAITPPTLRGKVPTGHDIGFVLAPRINAAGRMGQADLALELLTTDDYSLAQQVAEELETLNRERRDIQAKMFEQALHLVDPDSPAIVVTHPEWHAGVMGIVASKLLETFYKPVFIMAEGKGSVRSTAGISAVQGLRACHDLLKRYGGHMGAAGFSFDEKNFAALRERLYDYVRQFPVPQPTLLLDGPLPPCAAPALLGQLAQLEPCGEGNRAPFWHLRGQLQELRRVGGKKDTLQFKVGELKGVRFRVGATDPPLAADVAGELQLNEWRGQISPQLQVHVAGIEPQHKLTLSGAPHQGEIIVRYSTGRDAIAALADAGVWAYASAEIGQYLCSESGVSAQQVYVQPPATDGADATFLRDLEEHAPSQVIFFVVPSAAILQACLPRCKVAFYFGDNTLAALSKVQAQQFAPATNLTEAALAYHHYQWAHAYQVLSDESWTRAVWALAGYTPAPDTATPDTAKTMLKVEAESA